ncbi:hypothetical protein ACEPT7_08080, partial [Burkholderia ubonensis]
AAGDACGRRGERSGGLSGGGGLIGLAGEMPGDGLLASCARSTRVRRAAQSLKGVRQPCMEDRQKGGHRLSLVESERAFRQRMERGPGNLPIFRRCP